MNNSWKGDIFAAAAQILGAVKLFSAPGVSTAERKLIMATGSAAAVAAKRAPRWVQVLSWACRIVAAVILLQTLFFKFTAAPESVYIFTKVHAEPWGRIGSGVVELIAAVLLLI